MRAPIPHNHWSHVHGPRDVESICVVCPQTYVLDSMNHVCNDSPVDIISAGVGEMWSVCVQCGGATVCILNVMAIGAAIHGTPPRRPWHHILTPYSGIMQRCGHGVYKRNALAWHSRRECLGFHQFRAVMKGWRAACRARFANFRKNTACCRITLYTGSQTLAPLFDTLFVYYAKVLSWCVQT